ncbi:MAG: radical SAM protein [Desulfobacterota bacterium]|nr:radical SAM protein [Thermodesulfobacteriota bacterium]
MIFEGNSDLVQVPLELVKLKDPMMAANYFTPVYLKLLKNGGLSLRVVEAYKILSACTLCPRQCKVNRLKGEKGFCESGNQLVIAHYGPHFGEEPPLTGSHGAGTIFFTYCNLRCSFCQNYQISHQGIGYPVTEEKLAEIMLYLQSVGCHNIDLVTPSHFLPFILKAIFIAATQGLKIPLVYNSGGYESLNTLKLLDGIIDIYLPDWKYADKKLAQEYSKASDYPQVCELAIKEMLRQTGNLLVDSNGIAQRGLIIRHLVLPYHRQNSKMVLYQIAKKFSPLTRISLMSQYAPKFKAKDHPLINRPLWQEEYHEVVELVENLGFEEYWVQEIESQQIFFPDFKSHNPFSSSSSLE